LKKGSGRKAKWRTTFVTGAPSVAFGRTGNYDNKQEGLPGKWGLGLGLERGSEGLGGEKAGEYSPLRKEKATTTGMGKEWLNLVTGTVRGQGHCPRK